VTASAPETTPPAAPKPRRWKRRLAYAAIAALALFLAAALVVKDHVRTLCSLRRVPDTNAFVMDYYLDYHMDKIRAGGMDVHHIEDSCLGTLLPDFLMPIATRLKHAYLSEEIKAVNDRADHCSTVALRSSSGDVFFGRNFDYDNSACLILRVHDRNGLASIAVIDLAYLGLNRPDLDQTGLIQRLPLLFAPYYVMDGMNRYGVAVSDMSVDPAEPPTHPGRPAIILSTLERLILDYAKDADEAIELVRSYNVHFSVAREHLMVADAAGRFRIVEFLDGKIRVTPAGKAWQVCTNSIAWNQSEKERADDCPRYRIGSAQAEKLRGAVAFADARRVARSMSVDFTMWTSVYNLRTGEAGVIYRNRLGAEYRDLVPRQPGLKAIAP
jgi:hypothetical protein